MCASSAKKREAVLVLMYATFWCMQDKNALIDLVHLQLKISKSDVNESLQRAVDIAKLSVSLEKKILPHCSCSWSAVGYLEKIILKLCCYEILYVKETPHLVVISEGIRLASKFAGSGSCSFINAVLDSFCKSSCK